MSEILQNLADEVAMIPDFEVIGKVRSIKGLLIEVTGLEKYSSVGSRCEITARNGDKVQAEVIGVQDEITLLMPFHEVIGVGSGCEVTLLSADYAIYPTDAWLGRVVSAFGEPIDGKGPLPKGGSPYYLKAAPPPPHERRRVKDKLDMGVRAVNAFLTCCRGQRMGIFSGSGVGKSMMMAMFTKFADTDVKVIGLIGERGREVQEFLEEYLGEEGLSKAVVVVATSDESALARRQAAYLTMTISEYYRDQKKEVLAMMDSITRFAMAQREIGLAAGEPPTTKGYTPSVFAELPKLLERAGPGTGEQGMITGLISVLVEGDDTNEPIADAVRSILDGHIVLDRNIAARGRYPAIDVLNSISRTVPMCNNDFENRLIMKARGLLSTYDDMADMIRIGAYKAGSDHFVDEAVKYHSALEKFLSQFHDEKDGLDSSYNKLAMAIDYMEDSDEAQE